MNLNKSFVLGRLTQDPDVKTLPSGQSVANFGLATNRFWTNAQGAKQEATEFHNIVLFGKLADIAASYARKGQLLFVEGRLQTRSWQDQNGTTKYKTEIVGENIQLGPKSQGQSFNPYPQTQTAARPNNKPQEDNNPSIPVINVDEDIADMDIDQQDQEEKNIDVKDIPF